MYWNIQAVRCLNYICTLKLRILDFISLTRYPAPANTDSLQFFFIVKKALSRGLCVLGYWSKIKKNSVVVSVMPHNTQMKSLEYQNFLIFLSILQLLQCAPWCFFCVIFLTFLHDNMQRSEWYCLKLVVSPVSWSKHDKNLWYYGCLI